MIPRVSSWSPAAPGTLGRLVVSGLREAGRRVRVLSRPGGPNELSLEQLTGDLDTGYRILAAVQGAELIVHCPGAAKGDGAKARQLVRAASGSGVRHLVNISVVGADRMPVVSAVDRAMFGYFASKLAAEQVVAESGLPWTTLRATLVFDLVLTVAQQMIKLPVVPTPAGVRFQPVDTAAVATRVVELATSEPRGRAPNFAGPTVYPAGELLRGYLRAQGRRRP